MDEHHNWYNGSVWHKDWPQHIHVGQWPIFYGPVILLHFLKTIWWRNVVLGIMDQCDTKIDLLNFCGSVTYISWSIDFAFCHCHRLKLFVYIKKWHRPGVFVPLSAFALVWHEWVTLLTVKHQKSWDTSWNNFICPMQTILQISTFVVHYLDSVSLDTTFKSPRL